MIYGKTVLCQKERSKGYAVDNYGHRSSLPLMYKWLMRMVAKSIYPFLEKENVLPDEQKVWRKESRGTIRTNSLLIKLFLEIAKRHTNPSAAWVHHRKAYDMIPNSWILECLDMFSIAGNVKQYITDSMSKWKIELTSLGESLRDVCIRRGIFQGDSLSPLLFVLRMVQLTLRFEDDESLLWVG